MKKRIFIASHYMHIGGAEISLIGLLQSIDYSKYNVDLFIYSHIGELMDLIPKEVNVLPEDKLYAATENPLKSVLLSKAWIVGMARLLCKLKMRQYRKRDKSTDSFVYFQIFENIVYKVLPSLFKYGEYDLALNFIADTAVVTEKVKAKKTVTWIHSDYSSFTVDPQLSLHYFNKVDYIASISQAASAAFLKVYPSLESKVVEIENILSPVFVKQRALAGEAIGFKKKNNAITLLSIGRFCTAKNYDNLPFILKGIREKGINAYWYIIGFGEDEALIMHKIKEAGMKDYVIILGKKENPYPYIKECDWYVQPSRYEGKSVTVREAQMLGKAVIIANYTTAKSQVNHGVDGMIVPQDNKGCIEAMANIIVNQSLKNNIEAFLIQHDYGNVDEVNKIYKLID